MTQKEFIATFAERANMSLDRAEVVMGAIKEVAVNAMARDGLVEVPHLGTMKRIRKQSATGPYDAVFWLLSNNLRKALRADG